MKQRNILKQGCKGARESQGCLWKHVVHFMSNNILTCKPSRELENTAPFSQYIENSKIEAQISAQTVK